MRKITFTLTTDVPDEMENEVMGFYIEDAVVMHAMRLGEAHPLFGFWADGEAEINIVKIEEQP